MVPKIDQTLKVITSKGPISEININETKKDNMMSTNVHIKNIEYI